MREGPGQATHSNHSDVFLSLLRGWDEVVTYLGHHNAFFPPFRLTARLWCDLQVHVHPAGPDADRRVNVPAEIGFFS
jgi:hypothetical protein